MGKVFVDMAMSLDGFVSGPNGEDGGLHDWYFTPAGHAVAVIDELLDTIGAMSSANGRLATSRMALTPPTKCRTSCSRICRGNPSRTAACRLSLSMTASEVHLRRHKRRLVQRLSVWPAAQ